MKLKQEVGSFLNFLSEEYSYLTRIKLFLVNIPDLITTGEITQVEFQNFLEKFELETASFVYEKNRHKERISRLLNISPDELTFRQLVKLGFKEFEEKGFRVLRMTNEINMQLLKISVFMKNFSKLQSDFKRLNSFLYQNDYSARGSETTYNPGGSLYMEA